MDKTGRDDSVRVVSLTVSSFGDEYAAPGGREKLAIPTSAASTRIRENRRIGKSFLPGASVIIRLYRTPPLSVPSTALGDFRSPGDYRLQNRSYPTVKEN